MVDSALSQKFIIKHPAGSAILRTTETISKDQLEWSRADLAEYA
jgi:hypothetical protein